MTGCTRVATAASWSAPWHLAALAGAGGLRSTADDLLIFLETVRDGTPRQDWTRDASQLTPVLGPLEPLTRCRERMGFMASGAQAAFERLVLAYPFQGRWLARNSPARRVPSHGTHVMGTTYAIDFIPVDARGRSAPRSWRAAVATETPEAFIGFGAPILAPCSGRVAIAHDGEPDHEARRSQLTLIPYMLSQARRARGGPPAIAGNHVVIAIDTEGPFILLAHLRRGSVTVTVGDEVQEGDVVGCCGNSGNSTQPHLHIQATDSTDWDRARGLPIAFTTDGAPTLPGESEIVTV